MKNSIFKKFILFLTVLFMNTTFSVADPGDTLSIPIVPIDGPENPMPILAPPHGNVIGFLNASSNSISLRMSSGTIIACVRFYRNGLLVITDDAPIPYDDTLYYNLSSLDSGLYTVELIADDGTIYIGTFTL